MDTEQLNYVAVVSRLNSQAKWAKVISIAMIYSLVFIISLLLYNAYRMSDKPTPNILSNYLSNEIASYINVDVAKNIPPKVENNGLEKKIINELPSNNNINETLENFTEAMKAAASSGKALSSAYMTSSIVRSVNSILLTLTLVAMGIYAIKIVLIFIRYYSQLSTRYNSQAIAFLGGCGDIDKTIKLLEALSTNDIKMGSTPDSIYEKAFDVLSKSIESKKT